MRPELPERGPVEPVILHPSDIELSGRIDSGFGLEVNKYNNFEKQNK